MNQEYKKPEIDIIRFDTEDIMNDIFDPSMGLGEGEDDWE